MKYEYLLLNLVIIAGPLVLSFEKKMHFVERWRFAIPAILVTALPYLIWDAAVTGRHWWFNESYTLDVRILGLPLEECLFFFTVPFAEIFIWESLRFNFDNRRVDRRRIVPVLLYACAPIGAIIFVDGRQYTGLMLIALGAAAFLDRILQTGVLQQKLLYVSLAIAIGLILVFNGYLTARPVVLYDEQYQIGFRIGTIPLEDFGYGFSLLKFKAAAHG